MSVVTTLIPAAAPAIEHADALDWLAARDPASATAVIYRPALRGGHARARPGRRCGRERVRAVRLPV